jgi:hypothetical protein
LLGSLREGERREQHSRDDQSFQHGDAAGSPVNASRRGPRAWRKPDKTARWRRLRKFQLMQHPLCKFCLERGIVTRANVVDHVAPHKGDWTDFITGDLQSLRAVPQLGEAAGRAARLSL